ncbi:hypothetical protein AJ78_05921 [Emergomyces pasteurianus Ep9510]|uniref:C3H1-type domain-containing protein n=1 Tax=Emergomyces pasteurianus Ep9510 TaxID=1447872 RepID=A0A1J9PAT6_9EURO|nr:hypothetical protein AJ78_05921 [Emergomyces pasteurianus Ep9510]
MPVCIFYQQGRCKFGDRCKNEHPGAQSAASSSPFGGGGNRFGVFQQGPTGGGFGRAGGGAFGGGHKDNIKDNKYALNPDDIKADLTPGKGRPQWIFSCYGPGKNAPIQLFGGPQREQSFEEMRALHYAAAAAGNAQQAVQDAMKLYAETEAQIQAILNDTEGAVRYIIQGENTHPNRIDIIEGKTGPMPTPFAQPTAFSQPSTSPTAMTTSPFGQPSGLGQAAGPSPFAQPSALGQQSAFGKPALGQTTPFGQPSAMGSTQAASPFGQPSTSASGFGQSPFTQAANTQATTPFGGKPIISSPFAQILPQNQQQQQNPFGQPSTQPPSQPFGQPQPQQQNPFGQPQLQSNPPLAQPTTHQNPFSAAPPPVTTATAPTTAPSPAIAQKAKPHLDPLPSLQGETRRDPVTKRLLSWKGQAVKYVDNEPCYQHPDDAGTFVRIYFPDGPPKPETLRDAEGRPEEYTAEIEAVYRFVREHRGFGEGIGEGGNAIVKVPELPPRGEWCGYDL